MATEAGVPMVMISNEACPTCQAMSTAIELIPHGATIRLVLFHDPNGHLWTRPFTEVAHDPAVWTHAVCRACWRTRNPTKRPVRTSVTPRKREACCGCGGPTTSGIYVSGDPQSFRCSGVPGYHHKPRARPT